MTSVRHAVCPAGTTTGTPVVTHAAAHFGTCRVQNQNQILVLAGLWSWVADVRRHASGRNRASEASQSVAGRRGRGDACGLAEEF